MVHDKNGIAMKVFLRHLAALTFMLVSFCSGAHAEDTGENEKVTHRIGLDTRAAWLAQSHPFFRGENGLMHRLDKSASVHLQYSFEFPKSSLYGKLYPTAYQGVGLAWNTFFDKEELGTPAALYVFQGAQIARIGKALSLDYEWNFGVSFGWKPYDAVWNSWNSVTGSKFNAYINAGLMLTWHATPALTISGGLDLSHFSNGNTRYQNAGVNTAGGRIGAVYAIGRNDERKPLRNGGPFLSGNARNRITVDAVIYGATRFKGMVHEDEVHIAKGNFGIVGLNITPLCRISRCFQAGVSLDVQYDESANIGDHIAGKSYSGDGDELRFFRPPLREQLAAGLSARAELVMPIFTISLGIGHNIIYSGDDLDGFYQIVALKAGITRHIFLHVGYKLINFHDPNNLMLGVGWKFGNQKLF